MSDMDDRPLQKRKGLVKMSPDDAFDWMRKASEDAMAEHFEKERQRYFGGGGASGPPDSLFGISAKDYDLYKKETQGVFTDPGPPPCIHQPIDVGFAVTKMVCKKCNKDL